MLQQIITALLRQLEKEKISATRRSKEEANGDFGTKNTITEKKKFSGRIQEQNGENMKINQ